METIRVNNKDLLHKLISQYILSTAPKKPAPSIPFQLNPEIYSRQNLIKLDSAMPQFLAQMHMCSKDKEITRCKELVELVAKEDSLGYGSPEMYEYKFKKFLCACVFGMAEMEDWEGMDVLTDGYIIAKTNGEMQLYHVAERKAWEQHLYENAMCDAGSLICKKHERTYELC